MTNKNATLIGFVCGSHMRKLLDTLKKVGPLPTLDVTETMSRDDVHVTIRITHQADGFTCTIGE